MKLEMEVLKEDSGSKGSRKRKEHYGYWGKTSEEHTVHIQGFVNMQFVSPLNLHLV